MKYISLPSCREVEEDIDTKLCCLKNKQINNTNVWFLVGFEQASCLILFSVSMLRVVSV